MTELHPGFIAFRDILLPRVSLPALHVLAGWLRADSPILLQGYTTEPPLNAGTGDWPCSGGCLMSACGMAEGLARVAEVEDKFNEFVTFLDATNHPEGDGVASDVVDWWDDNARSDAIREALEAVEFEIGRRG